MRMNDLYTLIPNMVPLCISGCLAPSVLVTKDLFKVRVSSPPGREVALQWCFSDLSSPPTPVALQPHQKPLYSQLIQAQHDLD